MIALLLIMASDAFAGAKTDIDTYCAGQTSSTKEEAQCVTVQRQAMARYVTIMAGFDDPGHRFAANCMKLGKQGRFINWPVAKACMQRAAKGKMIGSTLGR